MKRAALFLFGLILSLQMTGDSAAWCQENETVAGAAEPVQPAAQEAAADEVEDSALSQWDRLIYVPFRELQNVLGSDDASVVIPYKQYLELLRHYLADQSTTTMSPAAVITSASYSAMVEDDVVRITAELNLNVLEESAWVKVPVSFGAAAIGTVQPNDGSVLLQGNGDGAYELLLKGPGTRTVTIELLAMIQTSPESRSFRIACPPTGISNLEVTVPEPEQAIEISPRQVMLPGPEAVAGTTTVRASLGSTDHFEVKWNPRAGSKPVMDLLSSATNQTETRIEAGLIQAESKLSWEILRGELREVVLLAPKNARIIDVLAPGGNLRSWEIDDSAETHQQIRVELLSPATGRFDLTVQTERSPEGDTFQVIGRDDQGAVHGVHADGVVREAGRITVTTDAALTSAVLTQSGVKQVEAISEAKGDTESRSAWEFSGMSARLVMQIRPVEPRLLVQHAAQVVFRDDELRLRSVLNYTVERAGVFQLVIAVPDTLTIDNVTADGMSEFNVDKESGNVTLSLSRKRQGAIAVTIQAHQKYDATAEDSELEIPTVVPQGTERETGTLTIYAPQFLDVLTVDERLTGLFPARDASAPDISRLRLIGVWNFSRRPILMVTRTSPRPAQVAATIATTAQFEPEVVKVSSLINFNIQNAGLDTLRIAVPESVSENVRFEPAAPGISIRQRNRAAAAEDSWVTWTLVLQDETTGSVPISVNWEVPLNGDAPDAADGATDEERVRQFVVTPARVLPPFDDSQSERRKVTLTQARGEVRLLRHESLSITAESTGETQEAIDVRELELMPQEGYLAFRYFSQPVSVSVSIREHEIHEVVQTVVSRAAVEVVTEKQPLASWRCRFLLTTSERQRLRINLPAGAELQAPLLDDKRTTMEEASDVQSEEGWDAYYVNVSRETTSDTAFLLTIQFRCPIVDPELLPYEGRGGLQILRLPTIGDDDGSSVIQQTQLAIWAPKDIAFIGQPDRWTQVGLSEFSLLRPLDAPTTSRGSGFMDGWLDRSSTSDFATQGHLAVFRAVGRQTLIETSWWNRPFVVWVVSGTILALGLILRRTTWENKVTMVLLAVFGVSLWTFRDGYAALQFATAAIPGAAAVLVLWLLGLLLGRHAEHPAGTTAAPAAAASAATTPASGSPPEASPDPPRKLPADAAGDSTDARHSAASDDQQKSDDDSEGDQQA
jgi:hypothetical protein